MSDDDETTMQALIARGREAHHTHLKAAFTKATRPMGSEDLIVITRADFVAHADLCLEYVVVHRSLYVLGRDGSIVALMCRHKTLRAPP